jgi:hypothetical protein
VVSVTTAPSGFEGEGFPVRRAFAGVDPGTLHPFIHMDQMGEVDYAPSEPKGTPWHPIAGSRPTYTLDGTFWHQDLQWRQRAGLGPLPSGSLGQTSTSRVMHAMTSPIG